MPIADFLVLVRDAEQHSDEDKKRKKIIELRNNADAFAYSTEKSLKEYGDKISEGDRKAAEDALAKLRAVMNSDDAQAIESAIENLTKASHKLAEAMYADAAKAQQAGGPGPEYVDPGAAKKDGTVDADFTVVDDDDTGKTN